YPANLSLGWRPDPSLPALVCAGTRSQLDGSHNTRPDRGRRLHRSRCLETRRLVGSDSRLHADELLGRPATRASAVTFCKGAPPGWLCLPRLQDRAPGWGVLEMWPVRAALRHVPIRSRLPTLKGAIRSDEVPGLWSPQSHERLDGGLPCAFEAVIPSSSHLRPDSLSVILRMLASGTFGVEWAPNRPWCRISATNRRSGHWVLALVSCVPLSAVCLPS